MTPTALATRPAAEEAKPGVSGAPVALGTRVDIYPSSPLPEFNTIGGQAFAARLKGDAGSDLVAIVCNAGLPDRLDIANAMRSIDRPGALKLVDSGVVAWPDGARYAALVYYRPLAPRFMHSLDEAHPPMSEDAFNRHFLQPLVGVMMEFMRTGIVHGAIRPTNLFWRFGSTTPPQLGECLSAPAGMSQPVLFETIERGMAMPLGRGPGTHQDDCYALGVMTVMMLQGANPLKGLDDNAVVQTKMEHGTFNALVGHHRLSAANIELLRGLLCDNRHQRWTAAEVEQWLGGRRLTPKSSDTGRRANRQFEFAGKDYWHARTLARAFAAHVPEAARDIENGTLDKWMRRALGDEDGAGDVADAVASAKENSKSSTLEDQTVARTCCALDPTAPIRYRGLAIMPGGIAGMMAHAVASGGNVGVLADIISSQIISFWAEMHKQTKAELLPLVQQFERLAGTVEKTTYGNGIERAVYELNPSLPCLSSILRSQFVTTPRALLPALERVAASSVRPSEPMDRHIAAFLIVRDRRNEAMFESMNATDNSPRRGLAMLALYSEMQNRHGPENLPHLAQWLLPLLEPSIRRYFGKTARENIQKQVKEVAAHGDLSALARLIDNPQRLQHDEQEFVAARLLYLNILKEINTLEGRMASRAMVVQKIGKPLAATISGMVALLAVLFAVGRAVWTSL